MEVALNQVFSIQRGPAQTTVFVEVPAGASQSDMETWAKELERAIKGRVLTKIDYGHDGDVIKAYHALIAVESVITKSRARQEQMLHELESPASITINRKSLNSENDE